MTTFIQRSEKLPFEDPSLLALDCYYEVAQNGQVFRTIYRNGELMAEEPTSDSDLEARFAMNHFEQTPTHFKLIESDQATPVSELLMKEAVTLTAESFFVEAFATVKNDDSSKQEEHTEVMPKESFLSRAKRFIRKLLNKE